MNRCKRADLSRVFPFVDFHKNMAIAADGTISFCFKADLVFQDQYTAQNYIDWVTLLAGCIKELPHHTLVQQVDIYFPCQWENEARSNDFFASKQQAHQQASAILKHESYIILCFPGICKSYSPLSTFFSREETKNFHKNPFAQLETRLLAAQQTATQFQQNVSSLLQLTLLDAEAYVNLVHRYIALNFANPNGQLNGGFWKEADHINLADQKAQVVSLLESSAEPSYSLCNQMGYHGGVWAPLTDGLERKLNFPHVVTRVIRVIDSELFLKKHFNEWSWSQATKIDERKLQNIQHIKEEMATLEHTLKERNEPIVQLALLVIPFGRVTLATLQQYSAEVVAAFAQIGMRGYIEDIDTANLFFAALPGNAGQIYRSFPIPLLTAVAHLNSTTPFTGHQAGVLLANRYKEPIYFNPFNTNLDNQNAFIFGPSGSGKSFFNGKMIKDRFEAGHIVIVIDSGGTYRNLFKALGGKYVELTTEQPLALNPFLFHPNQQGLYIPDGNKILFLVQLIGKMWKGDLNKNPMNEVEKSLLSKWIMWYYTALKAGAIPTLTTFIDYLKQLVDSNTAEIISLKSAQLFDFQAFFIVLDPFAYGAYTDHFNATTQDYLLDHRLVCFELESIKSNSRLYPLVVQILFDFAFEMVAFHPEAIKFIDIEEGWTTLDDSSSEHIESFYRKGRKTKTSIRIITQDIQEIQSSTIAGAIKNNAASFILLYNDKASSRAEIGEFLGMNELDMQKYASLRRHNGPNGFREIFIKEMSASHVWLLAPSLWEHAMLTSNPTERAAISHFIQQYGNIEDGIAAWVYHAKQKQYA